MSDSIKPFAEWCAGAVEATGIALIAAFALYALVSAVILFFRRGSEESVFRASRLRLGRGILLGLEFLVAADIIQTVAIDLTFHTVGILAAVVAIRTFLSFTLDVELTGRWPWQHHSEKGA